MSRLAFRRKKKIRVVANENAGKAMGRKRERDQIIAMLEDAFAPARSEADLRVFRTRNLRDLDAAKDIMRRDCPDLIAVFGGDGSIYRLLGEDDGFVDDLNGSHVRPAFLFYGGGSTDTIKGELKVLGRDSVKATERIIAKIKAGDPLDIIHRFALDINGKRGFIYGAGLAATLLEKYNAKSPKGLQRIAKIGAWMLFNEIWRLLPPWKRESVARKVVTEHEVWSGNELLLRGSGNRSAVVASSLAQVGMGCRLTSRAIERHRHFHCVLSGLGFWRTAANLPAMFAGTPLSGDVVDEVTTKVVLRYAQPVLHTIDGELFGPDEMTDTVTIGRGPLLDIVRS